MRFSYQAEDKQGRVKRGDVEAQDQAEARRLLRESGFTHIAFQGEGVAEVKPLATPWAEEVEVAPTSAWQRWHWKRIGLVLVLLVAGIAASFAVKHQVSADPLYNLHIEGQLLLRGADGKVTPVPSDLKLRLRVRCGKFLYTITPDGVVFRVGRGNRSRRLRLKADYAAKLDANGRYTVDVAVRLHHVPTSVGLSIRGPGLKRKVHGRTPQATENRLVVKLGISILNRSHRTAPRPYAPVVVPERTATPR